MNINHRHSRIRVLPFTSRISQLDHIDKLQYLVAVRLHIKSHVNIALVSFLIGDNKQLRKALVHNHRLHRFEELLCAFMLVIAEQQELLSIHGEKVGRGLVLFARDLQR